MDESFYVKWSSILESKGHKFDSSSPGTINITVYFAAEYGAFPGFTEK